MESSNRANVVGQQSSLPLPPCPNSAVLPKSPRDVDDASATDVLTYVGRMKEHLFWSFLSDSFFLVGGICYVLLSLWDSRMAPAAADSNDTTAYTTAPLAYRILDIIAPLVYFFNSQVDLVWALRVQKRNRIEEKTIETWYDWRMLLEAETSEDQERASTRRCKLLRRHVAHRRTMLAALTFGIAAVCSVLAVLIKAYRQDIEVIKVDADDYADDDADADNADATWFTRDDTITMLDFCSVHVYLLSALIAFSGKRTRPWLEEPSSLDNPETLEDFGDLLFLLGSLVDGVLWHFYEDGPGWYILASCLWTLDACLYLRSDVVMARRQRQRHRGDDGVGAFYGFSSSGSSSGTFA